MLSILLQVFIALDLLSINIHTRESASSFAPAWTRNPRPSASSSLSFLPFTLSFLNLFIIQVAPSTQPFSSPFQFHTTQSYVSPPAQLKPSAYQVYYNPQ